MYPKEYIEYLTHYHGDRDYFECHEILEEYWKASTNQKKNSIWVGLILLAVSNYHHRRNNFPGALKTLNKAYTIFINEKKHLQNLGINAEKLIHLVSEKISDLQSNKIYKSINIPLNDSLLIKECTKLCLEKGFEWNKESDISNEILIHRHFTRDRSEVIKERMSALEKRKNNGSIP